MRNIERGSKIVCISNDKIILQAQRGNLEAVLPKLLCLRRVRQLMDEKLYRKAFELCRSNKLDLNLVFDLNPERFIERSEEILKSIEKPDYISLLINQLQNSISEELEYAVSLDEFTKLKQFIDHQFKAKKEKSKVNIVCDIIINALAKFNPDTYTYAIMTAHIKKEPSELEIVLDKVKAIKDSEQEQANPTFVPPHLNPAGKVPVSRCRSCPDRHLFCDFGMQLRWFGRDCASPPAPSFPSALLDLQGEPLSLRACPSLLAHRAIVFLWHMPNAFLYLEIKNNKTAENVTNPLQTTSHSRRSRSVPRSLFWSISAGWRTRIRCTRLRLARTT